MGPVIKQIMIVGLALAIGACSSVHSLTANDRLADNSKMIRVILHDERRIEFARDNYTVHAEQDSIYIDGTGYQSRPEGGSTAFTGTIRYRDIKEIQVIESTTFSRVYAPMIIIIALGAVFAGLGYLFVQL